LLDIVGEVLDVPTNSKRPRSFADIAPSAKGSDRHAKQLGDVLHR